MGNLVLKKEIFFYAKCGKLHHVIIPLIKCEKIVAVLGNRTVHLTELSVIVLFCTITLPEGTW